MRDLSSKSHCQAAAGAGAAARRRGRLRLHAILRCLQSAHYEGNEFMSPENAHYKRFEFEKCLPSARKVSTWRNSLAGPGSKRVHASEPEKCPLSSGVMRLGNSSSTKSPENVLLDELETRSCACAWKVPVMRYSK